MSSATVTEVLLRHWIRTGPGYPIRCVCNAVLKAEQGSLPYTITRRHMLAEHQAEVLSVEGLLK